MRRWMIVFLLLMALVACGGDDDEGGDNADSGPAATATSAPRPIALTPATPTDVEPVPITAANASQLVAVDVVGRGSLMGIVWSPDGGTLIAPGSHGVWLYDADDLTATPVLLDGHSDTVNTVAITPDGTLLASGSSDETVRLWDTATGETVQVLDNEAEVHALAFSADGTRLAVGCDNAAVRLWDTTDGTLLFNLWGHQRVVYSVAFSPDGTHLASVSENQQLLLWDANSGERLASLNEPTPERRPDVVGPVTFRGETLYSGWRRWNVESLDELAPFAIRGGGQFGGPSGMRYISSAISPDGTTIVAVPRGLEIASLEEAPRNVELEALRALIMGVDYSPDGAHVAVATHEHGLVIVEVASGEAVAMLDPLGDMPDAILNADGTLVATMSDDEILIWDVMDDQVIQRIGDQQPRSTMAFSDTVLAVADREGAVRLWDATSGELLATLAEDMASVQALVFATDGTRLAAGNESGVTVWSVPDGEQVAHFADEGAVIFKIQFNPDGDLIATADRDNGVFLWDAVTGGLLAELSGHEESITALAFSPDGSLLVTGAANGDDHLRLWQIPSGDLLAEWYDEVRPVSGAIFSPDGETIVSYPGYPYGLVLIDVASREVRFNPTRHDNSTGDVAFSPDGTVLAASGDREQMWLWDPTTGLPLAALPVRSGVTDIQFTPDGTRLLTVARDDVTVWGVSDVTPVEPVASIPSIAEPSGSPLPVAGPVNSANATDLAQVGSVSSGTIYDVLYSPDGTTLTVISSAGVWRYGEVEPGYLPIDYSAFLGSEHIYDAAYSPDGAVLASAACHSDGPLGCLRGGILRWDAATGEQLPAVEIEEERFINIAYSEQYIASANLNDAIVIWDAASDEQLYTLEGHDDEIIRLRFAPDGTTLISADTGGVVRLWDAAAGSELRVLDDLSALVVDMVYTADGSALVTAMADRTIRVWDTATFEETAIFSGHSSEVFQVALGPNEQLLYSGDTDGMLRVWDFASGESLLDMDAGVGAVRYLALHPDGSALTVGGGNRVLTYALSEGLPESDGETVIEGHQGGLSGMVFSPDGAMLVTFGDDRTIRVWDTANQSSLGMLEGHTATVRCAAFNSNGAMLATGAEDGTLRLWDLEAGTVQVLETSAETARSLVFSPDDSQLIATEGVFVRVWDVATGSSETLLRGHTDRVWAITYSPDGALLATGAEDGLVILYDATSLEPLIELSGLQEVNALAFSADGNLLAVGGCLRRDMGCPDGGVLIWEIPSDVSAMGDPLRTLRGFEERVLSVSFSADVLATAGYDNRVRLWDAQSGDLLTAEEEQQVGQDALFDPAGTLLAIRLERGSIISLWGIEE